MEVTFKVLKSTLERELEYYRKYLDLCTEIRTAVKDSEYDKLQRAVKEQERIVTAIADLEGSRLLLVDEFAEQYRLPKDTTRLADITEHADESLRRELTTLKHQLKSLVKDVQRENKLNSVLIGDSMGYIRGTFEIIAGVRRSRDTYTPAGKTPEQVKASRNILNRVA